MPVFPSAAHPDDPFDGCGKADALRARFDAGLDPIDRPSGWSSREAFADTDVLHNALDLEIIPSTTSIAGSNTMTIKSLADGLTEFTFMLRSNYTISQILFNNETTLTAASVGSYGRRVTLPRPIARDEVFTLRIAYAGPAVSRGFGSIEFTTAQGQPAVFTLSEPYFAATWWPAKDGDFGQPGDNSDKATFDLWITAPNPLATASNGVLQGIDALPNNRSRYRWRTEYPMASYLAAFGSSVYNRWTAQYEYPLEGGGQGTMPVEFFIWPSSDTPANRAAWERCIDMMHAFREPFGEYPFVNEKYGLYQFTFSGGMEHQTMSGQCCFGESLTAHELGHQWWGDAVTCRTWNDIWINEGFATYSEALWFERKPGSPGLSELHAAMAARRPPTDTGSVYRYDVSSVNSIFSSNFAYRKGAWVLHTLRHALGDDAFFDLLKAYRAAFEGSAATTDDFASFASLHTGLDLAQYFDSWVYGSGAPNLTTSWNNLLVDGQRYLRLRVRQTQAANLPTFWFPLDVRVTQPSGSHTARITSSAREAWYVIPLPGSGVVSSVAVDEFNWVLTGARNTESFAAGPPVVLAASPAPGDVVDAGEAPEQLTLTFSENITANAANFTLTRDGSPVAFTYAYAPANFRVTLSFPEPLAPGAYALAVADQVTANGRAMDGEFSGTLPSGNGTPGGAFVASFVVRSCPADFNADGFLDFFDLDAFIDCFEGQACPPGATPDFNDDGFVDFFDLDAFVESFEAGC